MINNFFLTSLSLSFLFLVVWKNWCLSTYFFSFCRSLIPTIFFVTLHWVRFKPLTCLLLILICYPMSMWKMNFWSQLSRIPMIKMVRTLKCRITRVLQRWSIGRRHCCGWIEDLFLALMVSPTFPPSMGN